MQKSCKNSRKQLPLYSVKAIMTAKTKLKLYRTASVQESAITKRWLKIDAADQIVGRLASNIASLLRGKHMPYFTPHVDCGDYVIVTNVEKVRFTGKKEEQKIYLTYSGYPGGQKKATPKLLREKYPKRILEKAVKRMLPKNRLAEKIFKHLFLYEGSDHPHVAQKPINI